MAPNLLGRVPPEAKFPGPASSLPPGVSFPLPPQGWGVRGCLCPGPRGLAGAGRAADAEAAVGFLPSSPPSSPFKTTCRVFAPESRSHTFLPVRADDVNDVGRNVQGHLALRPPPVSTGVLPWGALVCSGQLAGLLSSPFSQIGFTFYSNSRWSFHNNKTKYHPQQPPREVAQSTQPKNERADYLLRLKEQQLPSQSRASAEGKGGWGGRRK